MMLTPDEECDFLVFDILTRFGLISDTDYKCYIELNKKREQVMYVVVQWVEKTTTVVVTTDPVANFDFITPEIVKVVDEKGLYEGDNFGITKEGTWKN